MPRSSPPAAPRVIRAKYDRPDTCRGCVADRFAKGYVPASGPVQAPILFVGESPWLDELAAGFPFAGAAGSMLERVLRRNGWERANYRCENVLRCATTSDLGQQRWIHDAVTHCRQYSDPTLAEPHRVIVPLGNLAIRRVLNLWGRGIRVEDFHGTVSQLDTGPWVVPSYHPSHLQRGAANLIGVVSFDLRRAHEVAAQGWTPDPITLVVDPPVSWFDAWCAQYLDAVAADPQGTWLAIDVETLEKAGKDESTLGPLTPEQLADKAATSRSYTITRLNLACHPDEGITVPFAEPYVSIAKRALASPGVKVGWFFDYDHPRLAAAGCEVKGTIYDLPWLCHLLQSDVPLGLGFWAPFYSRDGRPWKHLAETDEGTYAAFDPAQTLRIGFGAVADAVEHGVWPTFERHVHRLKQHALLPAHTVGIQIDRPALDAFEQTLTAKASEIQTAIVAAVPDEYRPLTPKGGLKARPIAALHTHARTDTARGDKPKKHAPDALKQELFRHAEVIEKLVLQEVYVCKTCGTVDVIRKHRCRPGLPEKHATGDPQVQLAPATVRRWFWKEPFNPNSWPQLLAYIKGHGHQPGKAKRTGQETTDRETLIRLDRQTGDPVYGLTIKLRAVTKVRSTYVLGVKRRLDADNRFHPVPTFRPSTGRLSYQNPNIQNVVGERAERENTLAAGFRKTVVAAPGCRLLEVDLSGVESCTTAWYCQSPEQLRLAKLGEHAALAARILGRPHDPAWSDAEIGRYFKQIKVEHFIVYDRAKRTNHGVHYGLTAHGMSRNFPDVYPSLRTAEQYVDELAALCPRLFPWQRAVQDFADQHGYIGGLPGEPPFGQPWGRRHWFWAIYAYSRISRASYLRAQAKYTRAGRVPPVTEIHGIPYRIDLGDDAKRAVAMLPQSTAADILDAAMIRLFDPDLATTYIGDAYFGRTPLRAPIHDSLLLEVPVRAWDRVLEAVLTELQRPVAEMPLPADWGMGDHLRIGVEAKASATGGTWGAMTTIDATVSRDVGVAADRLFLPEAEDAEEIEDLAVVLDGALPGTATGDATAAARPPARPARRRGSRGSA